jgi:hypothetical protein
MLPMAGSAAALVARHEKKALAAEGVKDLPQWRAAAADLMRQDVHSATIQ